MNRVTFFSMLYLFLFFFHYKTRVWRSDERGQLWRCNQWTIRYPFIQYNRNLPWHQYWHHAWGGRPVCRRVPPSPPTSEQFGRPAAAKWLWLTIMAIYRDMRIIEIVVKGWYIYSKNIIVFYLYHWARNANLSTLCRENWKYLKISTFARGLDTRNWCL